MGQIKFLILLLLVTLFFPSQINAATFRSGDSILISSNEADLSDLYLFGGNITLDKKVINDVVIGGGRINIRREITGSVVAAGGNIHLFSSVGNTVRIAGGDIVIDGPVTRDVIVAGGNVELTKRASIGGDLVFTGGSLKLLGAVKGRVLVNGGSVLIDSNIGKDVDGSIDKFVLGENAVVNGDLRYRSTNRATISDTAIIRGENVFTKIEKSEDTGRKVGDIVKAGTYYKLLSDLLFSLLFVILVPVFVKKTNLNIRKKPLKSGVIGLFGLVSLPIVSLVLLLIIWLGIFSFLLYFLILILAMVVANLFVGDFSLRWFYKRRDKEYELDWKAAVVGSFILYILWLIPIIGWLSAFIIYLLAIGGILEQLYLLSLKQKSEVK